MRGTVRERALGVGLLVLVWQAWAQKPSFEVASVKRNTSDKAGGTMGPRGVGWFAVNLTLRNLIMYAYAPPGRLFLPSQVIGGPGWIDTERFDIEAKPEGNERPSTEQFRLMLESLLEDRFRLKARQETRELPVYNLVAVKGGPKPSADQTPPDPRQAFIFFASEGEPLTPLPRGAMRLVTGPSGTTLTATAVPISRIVTLLQGQSDRIIIEKTGFTALLDVHLEFSPATRAAADAEQSSPSLLTAIQEIGLKLEPSKAPLDVVVIDNVERPSAN